MQNYIVRELSFLSQKGDHNEVFLRPSFSIVFYAYEITSGMKHESAQFSKEKDASPGLVTCSKLHIIIWFKLWKSNVNFIFFIISVRDDCKRFWENLLLPKDVKYNSWFKVYVALFHVNIITWIID